MVVYDEQHQTNLSKFNFNGDFNINQMKDEDEIISAYEFLEQSLTAMKHQQLDFDTGPYTQQRQLNAKKQLLNTMMDQLRQKYLKDYAGGSDFI